MKEATSFNVSQDFQVCRQFTNDLRYRDPNVDQLDVLADVQKEDKLYWIKRN